MKIFLRLAVLFFERMTQVASTGDDHRALFDYCVAGVTDAGLRDLLRKFTGAMPYLRLIAECNAILDPFDARVVEAYWLRNELLQGVEARALYDSLRARFNGQVRARDLDLVLGKAPAGARVHGQLSHQLGQCGCTGWQHADRGSDAAGNRWPPSRVRVPEHRAVNRECDGNRFVSAAQPGEWVFMHWGWACQMLSLRQVANLERWTRYHLDIVNVTL